MTIEIRELVIEARIRDGTSGDETSPQGDDDVARWVELVTRQVLDTLREQQERQ
ncbi:DUF5908 family protein [Serratia marcescens]|uniref:DUF5908 family protein n=1 Tax=Serratia ureilytica TaxID=300181 RepID=UPI001E3EC81D|nr:DUF5908 family protein [Serratia ureilytica]